jgi:hypothetical protein
MALFQGDTTAWEDIQIKLGNFAERAPKGPTLEETGREVMEKADMISKQEFVDKILSNRPQDDEDDDLATLRRARLDQLKKQDAQTAVRRITKESYMDEVTEGSKHAVIVVMMDRGGGSSFLESEMRKFAKEWITETAPSQNLESVNARFYVGDIDELIGVNFPAESLPFAVIYGGGVCKTQLANATVTGLRNPLKAIAKDARSAEESKGNRRSNDEDEITRDIRKELAVRRAFENDSSDSEEESDEEKDRQRSKGYADMDFERNVLRYR